MLEQRRLSESLGAVTGLSRVHTVCSVREVPSCAQRRLLVELKLVDVTLLSVTNTLGRV